MIEVIHYQNEANDKAFEASISEYYDEVRRLLPNLPGNISIYFSNEGIMPETGVGGHAYSSDIITISIDSAFKDKQTQADDIRPTIFHEAFHVYQNFTYEGPEYTAIESAIYEGMATVFERQYAGVAQPYGDWRSTPVEKLKKWAILLSNIRPEEYDNDWQQWKFYHSEFKERWILYKAGAFIVDDVLNKNKLDILDLKDKTAQEVLGLYNH